MIFVLHRSKSQKAQSLITSSRCIISFVYVRVYAQLPNVLFSRRAVPPFRVGGSLKLLRTNLPRRGADVAMELRRITGFAPAAFSAVAIAFPCRVDACARARALATRYISAPKRKLGNPGC